MSGRPTSTLRLQAASPRRKASESRPALNRARQRRAFWRFPLTPQWKPSSPAKPTLPGYASRPFPLPTVADPHGGSPWRSKTAHTATMTRGRPLCTPAVGSSDGPDSEVHWQAAN